MKTLGLFCVALFMTGTICLGQNTIIFDTANRSGSVVTGPFMLVGNDRLPSCMLGQLYVAGTTGGTLSPIGTPIRFATVDGVIDSPNADGTIKAGEISFGAPGALAVQGEVALYAWDGAHATFHSAIAAGAISFNSGRIGVTFGGEDPNGGAPIPAPRFADLQGWQGASLLGGAICPEPGTCLLAALGIGGLAFSRKRAKI